MAKKTIAFLTGSKKRLSLPLLKWAKGVAVFVEPQEIDEYRKAHPGVGFLPLPKNEGGFSYLMNQMIDITLELGLKYFLFSDDDVTDLKFRGHIEDKFEKMTDGDLARTFSYLEGIAEEYKLGQLAVSFAGQSWGAKVPYQLGVGAWGVHLTNARIARAVSGYDESLICFGDWDLSARMLLSGFPTMRTNLVTFVHKMKSHEGGAADIYKKKEAVREAACRCAAKFPAGTARVVHVPAHGLDEIRFNWKKLKELGGIKLALPG